MPSNSAFLLDRFLDRLKPAGSFETDQTTCRSQPDLLGPSIPPSPSPSERFNRSDRAGRTRPSVISAMPVLQNDEEDDYDHEGAHEFGGEHQAVERKSRRESSSVNSKFHVRIWKWIR